MKRAMLFLVPAVALMAAGCMDQSSSETRPVVQPPVAQVVPKPTPTENTPSTTSTAPTVATSTENGVRFETKTIKEEGKDISFDISYPQMVGASDEAMMKAFNTAVYEKNIKDQVAQMRTDLANAKKEGMMSAGAWDLAYDGGVSYQSPRLINVFLSGSQYTGGAHPNAIYENVFFDTQLKREVALHELFGNASSTLNQLSAWALAEIQKNKDIVDYSDPDWMKNGVAPDETNFAFSHLTSDGLVMTFPPYQVAAYVAGPQEVTVSWEKINPLLKPEYRK